MTNQDSTQRGEGPTHSSSTTSSTPRRSLRGFAAMDPQRQREIASLGGRAAHQSGHAHEFTSDEARAAGRKRHMKNRTQEMGSASDTR
jgi:general stress protein YciG